MVNKPKILITGGNGFLGSHLVKHLSQNNSIYSLDISDNLRSYYFIEKLDKISEFIKADVKKYEKLKLIINKIKPVYIIHLAAKTLVEDSYKDPLTTFETNIMGTVNILETSRNSKFIKGIVIASSDKAYGKLNIGKYKENHPLKGDHPYEVSKSSADLIAQSYFKTYHLPVVVTRSANIYGGGDLNFSRIIPGIMKALIQNTTLNIRSDGKFIRNYIYVEDVVNGYMNILDNFNKIKGETFNFASKDTFSVIQLISIIEKALDKKIKYKILNYEKNEIPYQSLNFKKAKKFLNWKPNNLLKKAGKNTFLWYQNNL